MKAKKVRTISISKGLLAGLIGGLVGAAAKVAAEKVFPPRVEGQPAPPLLLVERVNDEIRSEIRNDSYASMTEPRKDAAVSSIHWAFGGMAGAAYGAIVELSPAVASWQGAAFGLALNRITHEGALPVMGLSAQVEFQTPQELYSERATHIVYGVVTEVVRRIVRSRL